MQPPVSARVLATDEPVIVKTKALMEGVEGALSLAQVRGVQDALPLDDACVVPPIAHARAAGRSRPVTPSLPRFNSPPLQLCFHFSRELSWQNHTVVAPYANPVFGSGC